MQKVTYDMLAGLGSVVQNMFRMLYPMGLTMEQIEEKAESYNWMRIIREYVKGAENGQQ